MKHEKILVTPDVARDLLSRNVENRKIRQGWVKELARRITANEWRLTHQGIAVDSDGNLLDGQHRLLAVIKANVPAFMIVAKGFDAESPIDFPVDDGIRRSSADILGISRAIAETAAFIGRILFSQTPSAARVQSVLDVFQPTIQKLVAKCPTAKRGRSAAAVKAAVCIRANQQDLERTLNCYRSFVLMEFDLLPPSLLNLTRQIDDGLSGKEHYQLFARAYVAFDESRFELQKLMVRDIANITAGAREDIKTLMTLQKIAST